MRNKGTDLLEFVGPGRDVSFCAIMCQDVLLYGIILDKRNTLLQ